MTMGTKLEREEIAALAEAAALRAEHLPEARLNSLDSPPRKSVKKFYVRFHTTDDDKDKDNQVSGTIFQLPANTTVCENPEFGKAFHHWDNQTFQPADGDTTWSDRPGFFGMSGVAVDVFEGDSVSIQVRKTTDDGWVAQVSVGILFSDGSFRQTVWSVDTKWGNGETNVRDFPFTV